MSNQPQQGWSRVLDRVGEPDQGGPGPAAMSWPPPSLQNADEFCLAAIYPRGSILCGGHIFTRTNYNIYNLKTHIRGVHGEKKAICEYCGKKFIHKVNLKQHKDTVHKENAHRHPCEVCGKAFYLASQLKQHKNTVHDGRRDHKCDICGDAFSILSHVKRHIRTVHEGRKDHKCEYCGITRTTSTSLKKHILRDHKNK